MSIFLLVELVLLAFVIVFSYYDGAFAKIGLYPEDAILDAVKYYRDDPDMKDFIDGIQEMVSFIFFLYKFRDNLGLTTRVW